MSSIGSKEPFVISLIDDDDDNYDDYDGSKKPAAKVTTRIDKDGTIEILDSSEDEEDDDDDDDDTEEDDEGSEKPAANSSSSARSSVANNKQKRSAVEFNGDSTFNSSQMPSNKTKKRKPNSKLGDDGKQYDSDVSIVNPGQGTSFHAFASSSRSTAAVASSNTKDVDDDRDVEIVGRTGLNALEDFPHSREHCVVHPMNSSYGGGGGGGSAAGAAGASAAVTLKHCPNCYCYVCDIHASDCQSWSHHCHARHSNPMWRNEREQHKQRTNTNKPAVAMATGNGISSRGGMTLSSVATAATAARGPASSVSFTAASSAPGRAVIVPGGVSVRVAGPTRKDAPVKSALDAVTRVYPSERSPPAPFVTPLRHYQKQSLAFMMDAEASGRAWTSDSHPHVGIKARGGWLCSEVGMGKTAVVLALVASLPSNQPRGWMSTGQKCFFCPATVVLTSVSLMGQWEEECKKHAPHLKSVLFHPTNKKNYDLKKFQEADIIISSSTFKWDDHGVKIDGYKFHRVVQDESHLFYNRRSSACPRLASSIRAKRRWCVTATPVVSSVSELRDQSMFLRMPSSLAESIRTDPGVLKKYMIRHIKSQRINGSKALALPSSTTIVKRIHMNQTEKDQYQRAVSDYNGQLGWLKTKQTCKWFPLYQKYLYPLEAPFAKNANSSKLSALRNAIVSLQSRDPSVRVVIFTQFRPMCDLVTQMVKQLGTCKLYSFGGGTPPNIRSNAIREFQSTERSGSAVFVITTGTGSVGITLTAASHVFLMEPSINPSDEVQAAGRIHRLGQTKQVGVTKFVYENSFETNILKLHEEITAERIAFTHDGVGEDAIKILLRGL
eukprot:CAMPEP_0113448776 /NCGR_PEP_ID=MMETSP0014_2-20120614/4944_1 /TAXON_ID=2857 /ORGANISM="Nitzschia sp." /LENGTH=835 /DNA_ID=CAMNT_0000340005 /DNA_START=16 /DNA_END=2523 /DNA_ORIENTATION=- /assembly_acc=CAM_ASM_000159